MKKYISFILLMSILLVLSTCSNEPLNPLGEDTKNAIRNTEDQEADNKKDDIVGPPELVGYYYSGCSGSGGTMEEPYEFELTVDTNKFFLETQFIVGYYGNTFKALHHFGNDCCWVPEVYADFEIEDNTIILIEHRIYPVTPTNGFIPSCNCICMQDIEWTIENVVSGDYVVQIWNLDRTSLIAETNISIND